MKTTKTTNNAMNMDYMEMLASKSNNSIQEAFNNGTITREQLLSMNTIDTTKMENPIMNIQKMWHGGSMVGADTIIESNFKTVKVNNTTLKQIKKAIKLWQKSKVTKEQHIPYTTIWHEGINKFSNFKFTDGNYYVYYAVDNNNINAFYSKIANMCPECVTVEDVKQIQADFDPFARAWQESDIDVTKDKNKRFLKALSDIFAKVTTVSYFLANANKEKQITWNRDEYRKAKRNEKVIDAKIIIPELKEDVLDDYLADVNMTIKDAIEEFINNEKGFKQIYQNSNFDYYKQYQQYAAKNPELALYIKQMSNLYAQSFAAEVKPSKEQVTTMRNAIYSKAFELDIAKEEVINIAISTAMSQVYKTNAGTIIVKTDYKTINPFAIKQFFPAEYEYARTGECYETVSLMFLNRDIADGERIVFNNGLSEDGLIALNEVFTGEVYEKDGQLRYDKELNNYDYIKAVLTKSTYAKNITAADIKVDGDAATSDNGENAKEILANDENNTIVVAGKEADLLCVVTDSKMELLGRTILGYKELANQSLTRTAVIKYDSIDRTSAQIFLIVLQ